MDYVFLSLAYLCLSVSLMSSPMMIGVFLVFVSLVMALFIGAYFSKWFMFILLLVFTGGMMIMILYITNLAAGLKIGRLDASAILLALSFLCLPTFWGDQPLAQAGGLLKIYSWEILAYVMSFLLFGLFLVVFVVDKSLGALR